MGGVVGGAIDGGSGSAGKTVWTVFGPRDEDGCAVVVDVAYEVDALGGEEGRVN